MIKVKKFVKVNELNFEEYSLTKDGISQSLLCAFQTCPRSFLFSVNRWSQPQKTRQTGFGSLFHEMLDKTYRFHKRNGAPPSNKKLRQWIDAFTLEKSNLLMGKSSREIERDKAVAHILLENYIEYYSEDFESKKFDLVERKFAFRWNGFLIRGKIDASYIIDGERWLMEHKTKSYITMDTILKRLPFDIQLGVYRIALRDLTGDKIHGALYNIVRNPSLKSDSISELRVKLTKDIAKRPKHYFIRSEVPFTKEGRREFNLELKSKLNDVNDLVEGRRPCYRNQISCSGRFGECEFLNACSSGNLQGYIRKPVLFEELEK